MAATRFIAMHLNKGKTLAQCLAERTDYAQNPEKTNKGEFLSSYECDPMTVDEEFLLSKRQYQYITGRIQKSDVIAYQIRQSFKPGEVTPKVANQVGYETAMSFTKGKHAFIVATHVDKAHIHNHIIFNSTSLDCSRKFDDFRYSGLAVQKVSDRVCLEHGLSVIEKKPYSERARNNLYTGKISFREQLRRDIEVALQKHPAGFGELIALLEKAGYEYKAGPYPAIKGTGQSRYIRLQSLEGYTETDLRQRIAGKLPARKKYKDKYRQGRMSLLVDIQEKLKSGKGAGYERWAKVFNLKQMSQVMIFLQEHNIQSFEELASQTEQVQKETEGVAEKIKDLEKQMGAIVALRRQIILSIKTKDVYKAYRDSGFSNTFFNQHKEDIQIHKQAKQAFDMLQQEKLPSLKKLNDQYAALQKQKQELYAQNKQIHQTARKYWIAKRNVELLLEIGKEDRVVHGLHLPGR